MATISEVSCEALERDWVQLAMLRQQTLLADWTFATFCSQRNARLSMAAEVEALWLHGLIRADEITIHKRDFSARRDASYTIHSDTRSIGTYQKNELAEADEVADLRFHPFRYYSALVVAANYHLKRIRDKEFMSAKSFDYEPLDGESFESVVARAEIADASVNLAVLAEPLHWPYIASRLRGRHDNDEDWDKAYESHREAVRETFRAIPAQELSELHQRLLLSAHSLDSNVEVYMILRLASLDFREKLKGKLAGALLVREMAEVIRRATEDAHGIQLIEEDQVLGMWFDSARIRMYGGLRPLDEPARSRKYILEHAHLNPSIRIRWYCEGPTEEGALFEAFGDDPLESGIEVLNLEGAIEGDSRSLLLHRLISADLKAERFSFFMFDDDVKSSVEKIREYARDPDLIVGWPTVHEKDFEFANFEVSELVNIAAGYLSLRSREAAEALLQADLPRVANGRSFDKWVSLTGPAPALKGAEWGSSLMRYALKNPNFASGKERPIITAVRMANVSAVVDHRDQRRRYFVDPKTLQVTKRPDESEDSRPAAK